MRAVNLVPSDQRSGGSVGAGRSEGAAYAVLALFAGIALMALLYGLAHKHVSDRRSEAASLTAKAHSEQSAAEQLAPYTSFVAMRQQREQAVTALVDSRFDWAHVFHEFGRVLPVQVWVNSLTGTIAKGTTTTTSTSSSAPPSTSATSSSAGSTSTTTSSGGSTSTTSSTTSESASPSSSTPAAPAVTSATPPGSVPTFTIAGCATSQPAVALLLERLRLIDGVHEVNLQSSTKSAQGGGGEGGGAGCPGGDPAYSVILNFDPLPAAPASTVTSVAPAAQTSSAGGSGE